MTPPEYVHSPSSSNKRRRLSAEDNREIERSSRIPRLYSSPTGPGPQRNPSPVVPSRSAALESWPAPATAGITPSSYLASGGMTPMRSPMTVELTEHQASHGMPAAPENRSQTLPSLPHLPFERDAHIPREYAPRHVALSAGPMMDAIPAPYRAAASPAQYAPHHHSNRLQSLSTSAIHPYDHYGAQYGHHDFVRFGDFGGMGMGVDDKRRKRRGNLPRVTTDKLRHWFVNHLGHPYPTEDEKQELMRQTGLQMSRCSPLLSPGLSTQQYLSFRADFCFFRRPNLQLVHQRPQEAASSADEQCSRRSRFERCRQWKDSAHVGAGRLR